MSGESHVSLRKIVTQLHVPAEKDTVRNFLKTEGYKYTSPKKKPSLTDANQKIRAEWSKNVLEQITAGQINIENITFTDEKRFLLDGRDGCRKYWQLEEKTWFGKKFLARELWFEQALDHEEQQHYIFVKRMSTRSIIREFSMRIIYRSINKDSF